MASRRVDAATRLKLGNVFWPHRHPLEGPVPRAEALRQAIVSEPQPKIPRSDTRALRYALAISDRAHGTLPPVMRSRHIDAADRPDGLCVDGLARGRPLQCRIGFSWSDRAPADGLVSGIREEAGHDAAPNQRVHRFLVGFCLLPEVLLPGWAGANPCTNSPRQLLVRRRDERSPATGRGSGDERSA